MIPLPRNVMPCNHQGYSEILLKWNVQKLGQ